MRKMSFQLIAVSAPPTMGPAAEATAPPTAHTPTARALAIGFG